MEPITINRGEDILAQHTAESVLSHYGHPVWTVEQEEVEPGPAIWQQGDQSVEIDILCQRGGWLVCRQPDGILCGILWSAGNYYAEVLEDQDGNPLSTLQDDARVRGTIQLEPGDPEDLGAVLI